MFLRSIHVKCGKTTVKNKKGLSPETDSDKFKTSDSWAECSFSVEQQIQESTALYPDNISDHSSSPPIIEQEVFNFENLSCLCPISINLFFRSGSSSCLIAKFFVM
ncbi:hypothetical protein NPIL_528991 [Nephila pilipes]|uniref:Uncharacterized protein n=1 Tax=Nephila pilipes TaxID=299642 RepID=A0A8X6NK36_NEPPI|nr:hypothetical protein NPIL_528991 [Nephila pilipes]